MGHLHIQRKLRLISMLVRLYILQPNHEPFKMFKIESNRPSKSKRGSSVSNKFLGDNLSMLRDGWHDMLRWRHKSSISEGCHRGKMLASLWRSKLTWWSEIGTTLVSRSNCLVYISHHNISLFSIKSVMSNSDLFLDRCSDSFIGLIIEKNSFVKITSR